MPLSGLVRPASASRLPNGLKYIFHSDRANPILCLQLYVRAGSAWETDAEAGYSHFIEHLTFKSTRAWPNNEITALVASLGGSVNAYTDFDCTCYYLLLPAEFLDAGLRVLAQLAWQTTFGTRDVRLEKDIILEEIRQYENEPELDFFEYIQTTCFSRNPLRKPVLGDRTSLRKAKLADLIAFQNSYYQPQNAFLVATGDFDPARLAAGIEAQFGPWRSTAPLPQLNYSLWREPEPPAANFFFRKRDQIYLAYVLPELCEAHPDSDALQIALRYLAGGKPSRLHQRLVEGEQLCSYVKADSCTGCFSGVSPIVLAPTSGRKLSRVHAVFWEEYQALLAGDLDPAETELVKKDIVANWRYGFQGVENLANMIGAEEFIDGFERLYDYDQRVEAITPEDVIRAVRKYWQPAQLALYHQGPRPHAFADAPRPALLSHPPTPALTEFPLSSDTAASAGLQPYAAGYWEGSLPNGLRLLYRQLPDQPVCGFALSANVSQLSEPRRRRGVNYICSAAMLHSTGWHSDAQLMAWSRARGFNLRLEQHTDSTIIRGKCFYSDLEAALSVLAEIVAVPAFEPGHLNLLKSATIDSLRRDAQNPASYAYQRWFRLLFGPSSPYDRCSGEISDLRRLSRKAVLDWHSEHYLAGNFSLAIVGPHAPEEFARLASRLFSPLRSGRSEFLSPLPAPSPASIRTKSHRNGSGQAIVNLGGFAVPAEDRVRSTAFHLLAQIVGGDMDSRLFNILRERHGYAYQTGLDFTSLPGVSYWNAYAYSDPADRKACLSLMLDIIAAVADGGVSPAELESAQNYLCGMNRFELEKVSTQAALIANLDCLGYEPDYLLSRERRIRAVTLETVAEIAREWLCSSNIYTFVLT